MVISIHPKPRRKAVTHYLTGLRPSGNLRLCKMAILPFFPCCRRAVDERTDALPRHCWLILNWLILNIIATSKVNLSAYVPFKSTICEYGERICVFYVRNNVNQLSKKYRKTSYSWYFQPLSTSSS